MNKTLQPDLMQGEASKQLKDLIEQQQSEILWLRAIIDNLPSLIYWKDKNGVYLDCNTFALTTIGLPKEELIGKTDFELPWKYYAKQYRETDEKVMASNTTIVIEERVPLHIGHDIVLLTNKTPLKDSAGNIIGVLGVGVNISAYQQKILELSLDKSKAEAANKAKTEFLENTRKSIDALLIRPVVFSSNLLR